MHGKPVQKAAQSQRKPGKRKAAELADPANAPEAHQMPEAAASEPDQQTISHKKRKSGKSDNGEQATGSKTAASKAKITLKARKKRMKSLAASASEAAPGLKQSASMKEPKPAGPSQTLDGIPAQTPTSEPGQQDAVKTKRNRNKFKQDDESAQKKAATSSKAQTASHEGSQHSTLPSQAVKLQALPGNAPKMNPSAPQQDGNPQEAVEKRSKKPDRVMKAEPAEVKEQPMEAQNAGKQGATPNGLKAAGQSNPKQDGLLAKMQAKLAGSQFRWLNEQLYTCSGSEAFDLMQEQPHLFAKYHEASLILWPVIF